MSLGPIAPIAAIAITFAIITEVYISPWLKDDS